MMSTTQMNIHGDTVFAGNTAYREDIRTHFERPLFGRSDSVSVNDAKWTVASSTACRCTARRRLSRTYRAPASCDTFTGRYVPVAHADLFNRSGNSECLGTPEAEDRCATG